MNDPGRSISQQLWSVVWSLLAFAIVANLAWALLLPLLPVLLIVAVGLAVRSYRNRW